MRGKYREVEVKVQKDTRKTNSKRQSNDTFPDDLFLLTISLLGQTTILTALALSTPWFLLSDTQLFPTTWVRADSYPDTE